MSSKGKFYMTTAIAYTSGKPHIGNTYEIVLADAIARFRRQEGYDVYFQTGTDEHGQKIQEKAEKAGITPKEYVDNVAGEVKRIWDLMNTSYDNFVRTTDEDHEKQVKKIFKKLYDKGDIYKGSYEGLYCTPCESFWTESQLVDGKCPDCGREVQPAKEEAYFFKMSKYADKLIDYINEHPEFIQPVSRKNEMMNNFLLPGLQDLCVSRTSFSWGIPVRPFIFCDTVFLKIHVSQHLSRNYRNFSVKFQQMYSLFHGVLFFYDYFQSSMECVKSQASDPFCAITQYQFTRSNSGIGKYAGKHFTSILRYPSTFN
jgi:methionyl-tRNA synthetase